MRVISLYALLYAVFVVKCNYIETSLNSFSVLYYTVDLTICVSSSSKNNADSGIGSPFSVRGHHPTPGSSNSFGGGREFSLSSPEPALSSGGGAAIGLNSGIAPRSRSKAPPRKSVLDERNGTFNQPVVSYLVDYSIMSVILLV